MVPMNTISEDVLRGIDAALARHAPHLRPKLHAIMRSGLASRAQLLPGQSIHGTLTASVPLPDGEAILRALETIERDHGFNAKFADRQINWLVLCWRRFAEPPQLPPEP